VLENAISPSRVDDLIPDPVAQDALIPGTLTSTWPKQLFVDDPGFVRVEVRPVDWRDDADVFNDQGFRVIVTDDQNQSREFPIYGVAGTIRLRLDLPDRNLELVDPNQAVKSVTFRAGQRDSVEWQVRAVNSGVSRIIIRSDQVIHAEATQPFSDEQLASMTTDNIDLRLELEVLTTQREGWLAIAWWTWLPVLVAPLIPMALLLLAARRNPAGKAFQPALVATSTEPNNEPQHLGLVLSGGGMRATAFSLGAAMYLADMGWYDRVAQVASVSGGSLTNAYLAGHTQRHQERPRSAQDLRPLAKRIANGGLPLERSSLAFAATLWLGALWMLVLFVRASPSWLQGLAAAFTASVVFGLVCWVAYAWIAVRPAVRRWVPGFIGLPPQTTLRDLGVHQPDPDIMHVFTASATTSEHVHMSQTTSLLDPPAHEKASGVEPALGAPGAAKVADAVQASAAFPGLPRVTIASRDLGFERDGSLTLRDGGSLDNLGHIGATITEDGESADYRDWLTQWDAINTWIIVDSSALRTSPTMRRWRAPNRLIEALHLGFAADLAEMGATAASRTTAETAAALVEHFKAHGDGIYLSLPRSPYDICSEDLLDNVDDATRERRQEVIAHLRQHRSLPGDFEPATSGARHTFEMLERLCQTCEGDVMSEWATRASHNAEIRTTLSSLDDDDVVDLLHHGYTLTATLLSVTLNWPLPEASLLDPRRFRDFI